MMSDRQLAAIRSFLFTPANHPRRVEKVFQVGADAVILDLEDQVKKQKVKLQDNKGQKLLEEKVREMEMIKEEMKDVMQYKNEIFDLKAKVAELHEEINRKDVERELGQQMNLEDTSLVKSLRKDLT